MAKVCPTCNKTSRMGGERSLLRAHYNPVQWKRHYPNLQWATLPTHPDKSGARQAGKRIKLCTRCIKSNKHLTQAVNAK